VVALLHLVHCRVALAINFLGRGWSGDQGGIHHHSLPHRHPKFAEVRIDGLKDLRAQIDVIPFAGPILLRAGG